jgi:hypothetical protein
MPAITHRFDDWLQTLFGAALHLARGAEFRVELALRAMGALKQCQCAPHLGDMLGIGPQLNGDLLAPARKRSRNLTLWPRHSFATTPARASADKCSGESDTPSKSQIEVTISLMLQLLLQFSDCVD